MTTPRSRVLFMGTPQFAVTSLRALVNAPDLFHVPAVVTQPARPCGRGQRLSRSPVHQFAEAAGITVLELTRLKPASTLVLLAAFHADAIVVAAYGRILPASILALPPAGCINVHASLLPKYRGAAPIAHAIIRGDTETGVSIMRMEEGLDTGPVYATESLAISPEDTCGSLSDKLADLGAQLLVRTLPGIISGARRATPQDHAAATYAPLLTKEDGHLDFAQPADTLARRIRGLHPWPGCFAFNGEQRVQVLAACPESDSEAGPTSDSEAGKIAGGVGRAPSPGLVLSADAAGVRVACGRGVLRLTEVKPAGKAQMRAAAWAAGRGARSGDTLS